MSWKFLICASCFITYFVIMLYKHQHSLSDRRTWRGYTRYYFLRHISCVKVSPLRSNISSSRNSIPVVQSFSRRAPKNTGPHEMSAHLGGTDQAQDKFHWHHRTLVVCVNLKQIIIVLSKISHNENVLLWYILMMSLQE